MAGRTTAPRRAGSTRTLSRGAGGEAVKRTVLPGGLRVVTEQMPGVRSAAVGVWVGVGSRDETPALSGASHFLEHLLFKGTETRSALDIAVAMDAVGDASARLKGCSYFNPSFFPAASRRIDWQCASLACPVV